MHEENRRPFDATLRPVTGRDIAASLGPRPLAVIGAREGDEICFATVAWATPVSHTPPLVAFALRSKSRTLQLLQATGAFSISTPDAALQPAVETCGNASGNRTNKSARVAWTLLPSGGGDEHPALPALSGALTVFACRVESITEAGDHLLVVGSVEHAWSRAGTDDRGRIDATDALLCVQHDLFTVAR